MASISPALSASLNPEAFQIVSDRRDDLKIPVVRISDSAEKSVSEMQHSAAKCMGCKILILRNIFAEPAG
jgi:hypothetical protein